jgi:hypothetical protein
MCPLASLRELARVGLVFLGLTTSSAAPVLWSAQVSLLTALPLSPALED